MLWALLLALCVMHFALRPQQSLLKSREGQRTTMNTMDRTKIAVAYPGDSMKQGDRWGIAPLAPTGGDPGDHDSTVGDLDESMMCVIHEVGGAYGY